MFFVQKKEKAKKGKNRKSGQIAHPFSILFMLWSGEKYLCSYRKNHEKRRRLKWKEAKVLREELRKFFPWR
jgi:hypothetical protein